ncbi:MAG: hypothetical protein QM778_17155 [Myxococcales bacterium]
MLSLSGTAMAQNGTVTARFQGSPQRDGYGWATVTVRYAFLACPGDPNVQLALGLDKSSLSTDTQYWYKGKLYQLGSPPLPLSVKRPSFIDTRVVASIHRAGQIVGNVNREVGATLGMGCFNGELSDVMRFPPDVKDRNEFLRSMGLNEPTPGLESLRNDDIESIIERDLAEQERLKREAEAAAAKAAKEKADQEKAAAEQAEREKKEAEERAQKEAEEREKRERDAAAAGAAGEGAGGGGGGGTTSDVPGGSSAGLTDDSGGSSGSGSNGDVPIESTPEYQRERWERLQQEQREAEREAEQAERDRSLQAQIEAQQAREARAEAIGNAAADAITSFGAMIVAANQQRELEEQRRWEREQREREERERELADRWEQAKASPDFEGFCTPSLDAADGQLGVGDTFTGWHTFTDCLTQELPRTPRDHLRFNVIEPGMVQIDVFGRVSRVELVSPLGEIIVAERMQNADASLRIRRPVVTGPHMLVVVGVEDLEDEYRVVAQVAPPAKPRACIRGSCGPRWLETGPEFGIQLNGLYGSTQLDAQPNVPDNLTVPFKPFEPHYLPALQLARRNPKGSWGGRLGFATSTLDALQADSYLLRLSSRLTESEIRRSLLRMGMFRDVTVYSFEFADMHLSTYVEGALYMQTLLFGGKGVDADGEEHRQRMRFAMFTPALGVGADVALLDGLMLGFYVGGALNVVGTGKYIGQGGTQRSEDSDMRPQLFMNTEIRTTLSYKFGQGYRDPLTED